MIERYADAIVRSCVGVQPGEALVVGGSHPHRELLVALAEAGYRAGARLVEVSYADPLVRAQRIRWATEKDLGPMPRWTKRRYRAYVRPDVGIVTVFGESDPTAFDGLPPERVATDHQRPLEHVKWYVRAVQEERRRWVGCAWPTPAWAAQVFPDAAPADAEARLRDDILHFCRLGPDDPEGAWDRHVGALAARAEALTALRMERLELRGPGTELTLRLPPDALWLGGFDVNAFGRKVASNFPTEETYTSPDPRGTEGAFRCSRTLSFHGRLIDGIAGEFRGGRLVRLEAERDDDRDFLAAFLDADAGARRVGEVALVDATSRIGQAGRVYYDTLLDENAAAHFAFGFGFDTARAEPRGSRVNRSNLHLDVMTGTDDFEATAVGPAGKRTALIADGQWRI